MPLFDKPIDFEEAIQGHAAKTILPTTLSSKELANISAANKRASLFSAKVANADVLKTIDEAIGDILEPGADGSGLSIAYARERIDKALEQIGYTAPAGKENSIEDLGSTQRQQLIIETQLGMATGYGNFLESQTDVALQLFPAQELFRTEDRRVPRDWDAIWRQAAEDSADDTALAVYNDTGRMVALKDSPIWFEIGDFGNPFPPFFFQSGVLGLREIDQDEAEDLGLLKPGQTVKPTELESFDKTVVSKVDLAPDFKDQLLNDLGPGYKIEDGILQANTRLAANNCGTGAGGFQPGNKCAGGGDGGDEADSELAAAQADTATEIGGAILDAKTVGEVQELWLKKVKELAGLNPEQLKILAEEYDKKIEKLNKESGLGLSQKAQDIKEALAGAGSSEALNTIWTGNLGPLASLEPHEHAQLQQFLFEKKGTFQQAEHAAYKQAEESKQLAAIEAAQNLEELKKTWNVSENGFEPKAADAYNKKFDALKAAKKAAAKVDADNESAKSFPKLEGFKKVGGPLGSNPGGVYEREDGKKVYVKFQKDEAHARNERVASELYQMADAGVAHVKTGMLDGKIVTYSLWHDKTQDFKPDKDGHQFAAAENFGVHAWLANWDAVGLNYDNQVFTKDGLRTIDVGGSMFFRAQGEPKTFSAKSVPELKTMLDPKENPQAAKVFSHMSEQQMVAALNKVAAVTDEQIDSVVAKHWPQATELKAILKSRRDIIAGKAKDLAAKLYKEKYGEPAAAPAAEQKPVSNAPETPKPPGTPPASPAAAIGAMGIAKPGAAWGQKATTKHAATALAKIQKIHDAAAAGDLAALEAIKTNPSPTAKTYDKKAHAYKTELVELVKKGAAGGDVQIGAAGEFKIEQLAPGATAPKPKVAKAAKVEAIKLTKSEIPKMPEFVSKNTAQVVENKAAIEKLQELALAGDDKGIKAIVSQSPKVQQYKEALLSKLESKKPEVPPADLSMFHTSIDELAKAHPEITHSQATAKLSRAYIISKTPSPALLEFPSTTPPTGDAVSKVHTKLSGLHYSAASQMDGTPLKKYTGSSYIPMNKSLASGEPNPDAKAAIKKMKELQQPIPEGTFLSRKITVDQALINQYEKSIGHVIQDPAIISTSIDKNVWSGNMHWRITVGKGVKGLYAGNFSNYPGEKEMILPPGTRFYIKKVEKSGNNAFVDLVALPN